MQSKEQPEREQVGNERRKGTRCAVCVMCGRCFETDEAAPSDDRPVKWTGTRCDICVSCGKCAEAWGLVGAGASDADSGPTNWADAFKVMDTGSAGAAPPVPGAPGVGIGRDDASAAGSLSRPAQDAAEASKSEGSARPSSFACLKRGADGEPPDTSTGATPGVSSACKEHGFDDMEKLIATLGIKPPGVA